MLLTEWAQAQDMKEKRWLFVFERTVRGKANAEQVQVPERTADEWEAKYRDFAAVMDQL
jgi:hypothetical protein